MAYVVVQIGQTQFYAELLDHAGKSMKANYLATPNQGEIQRLRLDGKVLGPGNNIEIKRPHGIWLAARIGEVGEFTRSLMIQIEHRTKPAITLLHQMPPTLLVRWSK